MTGWLIPLFGEDLAPIANLVAVFLIVVLALIASLLVWRRLSGGSFAVGTRARRTRLGLLESTPVDSKRRLLLVRRDNVAHLILTGGPTDVVVEQDILIAQQTPVENPIQANKPDVRRSAVPQAAPAPAPAKAAAAVAAAPAVVAAAAIEAPAEPVPPIVPDSPAPEGPPTDRLPEPAQVADRPEPAATEPVRNPAPRAAEPRDVPDLPAEVPPPVPEDPAAPELDPEILRELQATLNRRTEPSSEAAAQPGEDNSLEKEMSKLLSNLSTDKSG